MDHEETKRKACELDRKILSLDDELTLMSEERDQLKVKVNEERSRCNILERQLGDKENHTADLMKKCVSIDFVWLFVIKTISQLFVIYYELLLG